MGCASPAPANPTRSPAPPCSGSPRGGSGSASARCSLTRPALKALGFEASDTSTRALARLAGSRDIALGLLTIAVRDDRVALREATAAAAAVDLGDAVCFAIAGRDPAAGRAAVQGILSGGAAAAVGAWAVRRLS